MSKEMMIVFVYDTEFCQKEEDDPVSSVLYFHPSWVSDVQKLSLCGQLMGTTYFLKESFFPPKIISLQNGKFCIKNFGRFVLAVGTDRNVNETLLEYRATLLKSLLETYHCDIQTIYNQFSTTGQYKNISEKLYHIFETYLPVLQYKGSLFQNMPFLKLPKSGNHIFLEAMQLLKYFQEKNGVLGGSILYHNKVVANQLPSDLAKVLIMTDPHRIKATADNVQVDFHIQIGVQLIVVYVQNSEYKKLKLDSSIAQSSFRNLNGANLSSVLPFQIKRKIKSDKSLIFSHIPEEEPVIINDSFPSDSTNKRISMKFNRPNNLPLRIKTVVSKEIPESGFNSINFDESDSFPEFIGKTSVVSTPMTENKVLLNADILSICMNAKSEAEDKFDEHCDENGLDTDEKMDDIQFFEYNNFFNNFFKNSVNLRKNKSLNDLNILKKNTGNNVTMKQYGIGLKKLNDREYSENNGIQEEYELDETIDDVVDDQDPNYYTITDPNYPVINNNNKPISNYLYQYYFDKFNDCGNVDIGNKYEPEDRDETDNIVKRHDSKENKEQINLEINHQEIKEVAAYQSLALNGNSNGIADLRGPKTSKSDRKSLSLPIKSMSAGDSSVLESENAAKGLPFETSAKRNKLSGIQLTPLMNKLTLLSALNQEIDIKSSGFSSWDTTPGYGTPADAKLYNKSAVPNPMPGGNKPEEPSVKNEQKLKKLELFIYGEKNSTLFLLLDTSELSAANKKELMHSIWELCITRLTKIETSLFQILNLNVETANEKLQDGDYSYINFNKTWDVLERSGPWTSSNYSSMEYLHKDFESNKHLSEILLRNNDTVIYGYQSGVSEIYYQQTAHPNSGLPPPADPMGAVQLSAKRRLERDHSIIIL